MDIGSLVAPVIQDRELLDEFAFSVVQDGLKDALCDPAGVRAGNVAKVEQLAEGLLLSGFAMQATQSSRPASGAEHQFSHLWEMEGHGVDITPRRLSHGFKVGLGSVSIAALYERLLERDLVWRTPAGVRLHVVSRRMTSFTRRHLAVMELEVTPLDGDLALTVGAGDVTAVGPAAVGSVL